MPELDELLATVPQVGQVQRILLRPARRAEPAVVDHVTALAQRGLAGDRRTERVPRQGPSPRQVTLIQAEHLMVIAQLLGRDEPVDAALTRRNLVISGIPLLACKGLRIEVGGAVLEGTGDCHPCSRMEEALGAGGYQAMRGHGGITAIIVEGGEIAVGDSVAVRRGADGDAA